jgi:thioredoxin reductase (NADPH)
MAQPEGPDLIIIGGGPAGLSAAINAASERMDTLLLDGDDQFGGQAGTSTLIENYPGFTEGVTGKELTSNMVGQALKFNVELQAPLQVEEIAVEDAGIRVHDEAEGYLGRAILVSCGVQYRRHNGTNVAGYLGRGVSYGSPRLSSEYHDQQLFVVGGANSAGQAVMYLSRHTDCSVHLLVRGKNIDDKMSAYLADRVKSTPNIKVHTETDLLGVDGDDGLKKVVLSDHGQETEMDADRLFLLIGAIPKTKWLPNEVARDQYGFVLVGGDLPEEVRDSFEEHCHRQPYSRETSVPGLFVAGDVRSGSIKRVASAVGEGSAVVPEIHRYLETHTSR